MPPKDIRAVVDKTAQFVARNGKGFEVRISGRSYFAHFEFTLLPHAKATPGDMLDRIGAFYGRAEGHSLAAFPDKEGFAIGSIEGRVAIHHVDPKDNHRHFAFKCHRETNDIYAVNDLKFHPTFGTFATTGSDGTFNFWDKEARQRLKQFNKACSPIPVGAFNREGNIFAYAVSYDWSKGSEHYNPRTNHLLLHPVPEAEIKSRNTARKGFGTRSSR